MRSINLKWNRFDPCIQDKRGAAVGDFPCAKHTHGATSNSKDPLFTTRWPDGKAPELTHLAGLYNEPLSATTKSKPLSMVHYVGRYELNSGRAFIFALRV
jgi:hypothetical protein